MKQYLITSISEFLKDKTFENSKEGYWAYNEATGNSPSLVYFARIFALDEKNRYTKTNKAKQFIKTRIGMLRVREAYFEYIDLGNEISYIYFSRVWTAVRKQNESGSK